MSTNLNNQTRTISCAPCPTCNICGTAGRPLYSGLSDQLFGTPGSWSLKQCPADACGLLWLDPMPLPADIHLAYGEYYTHQQARLAQRIINRLNTILLACFYRLTGLAQASRNARRRFVDLPPGRLLDIGCGNGQYLHEMRARGWQVEGVETDPKCCRSAASKFGLQLHQGQLQDQALAADRFDVITLNHVIEHLPEPVAMLRECHRILKPGGSLVITTPNPNGFGHQLFGQSWRGLEPPRHLHLFSPSALRAAAAQAGFNSISLQTSIIGCDYILGYSRHLAETPGPANISALNFWATLLHKIKTFPLVFRAYRRWRQDASSGDEIVLICRKK